MDSNVKKIWSHRDARVPGLQFFRSEVFGKTLAAAATKSLTSSKVEHYWRQLFFLENCS